MNILLANKSVGKTGRVLARHLGLKFTHQIRNANDRVLVRWGQSGDGDTDFNNGFLIHICSNKKRFSDYCEEHQIPAIVLNTGTREHYPVFIRTQLESSQGKGIVLVRDEDEFRGYSRWCWSYYHPFYRELGVHILGGQIVKIFKKVFSGETEAEFPVRTAANYHYALTSIEKFKGLTHLVEDFYSKLPINMGRLDVGYSREDGYTIIEFNSAPSLINNDDTLNLYVEYLRRNVNG